MKNEIMKLTFFHENNIKINKMRFALLFLSLLFISSESIAQTTLVKVIFIVEDFDTHKGISGALVTVRQTASTQPTLADGKVTFNNVPVGEIEYFIMKEGYQFETGRVNVSTDEKTNTFRIPISKLDDKKILVTGEVTDSEGRDVKDAWVEVKIADQVRTVTTDASGNYSADIAPSAKFPSSTMRIEVKKGDCKKTETVDIPRTNVVYKDFKLDCNSADIPSGTPKKPDDKKNVDKILARKSIDEIEVRIIGFEQSGSSAKVFFEWENKSVVDPKKEITLWGTSCSLQDQDSNTFRSSRMKVGNIETGVANLIQGNTAKGFIEFEVGNQKITKVNLLTFYVGNQIEFYNIPVTAK
jgi:hypothetical protein